MSNSGDQGAVHLAVAQLAEALLDALRCEFASTSPGSDRLVGISEAATVLGVGRTALYKELTTGRLRSFKVGRRRLIPASVIAEYIAREATEER